MKNSFFILSFFLSINCIGQSDTTKENKKSLPYYIQVCKDVMTDKELVWGSKIILCSEDGKKGFSIRVSFEKKKDEVKYQGLTVISAGIGNCMEKDELIFLFEDDSKYSLKSWQDFNCAGKSYFDLYGKFFDEFNSKKIKAIRLTNGRSYESYTYKPTSTEASYFIEVKQALDNNKIVNVKCDE